MKRKHKITYKSKQKNKIDQNLTSFAKVSMQYAKM